MSRTRTPDRPLSVRRLGYGLVEVTIRGSDGRTYTGGAPFGDVQMATYRARLRAMTGARGR